MTEEKYKELVSAYEKIKENCKSSKTGHVCPFSSDGGVCDGGFSCILPMGVPEFWEEPKKVQTWTEAERALAIELSKCLASKSTIKKDNEDSKSVYIFDVCGTAIGHLPAYAFLSFVAPGVFKISDIIGEG